MIVVPFEASHLERLKLQDAQMYLSNWVTVDVDFPEAHRWAKMLGFKMEAERMEAYAPDGRACSLYARIL